jgi:hypothetical protein
MDSADREETFKVLCQSAKWFGAKTPITHHSFEEPLVLFFSGVASLFIV